MNVVEGDVDFYDFQVSHTLHACDDVLAYLGGNVGDGEPVVHDDREVDGGLPLADLDPDAAGDARATAGTISRAAPIEREILPPRVWTPGTSRAAVPAIFSTTPSAMAVLPRMPGAVPGPVSWACSTVSLCGRDARGSLVGIAVLVGCVT